MVSDRRIFLISLSRVFGQWSAWRGSASPLRECVFLCAALLSLALASCEAKLSTKVASNCAKPTDPSCKDAAGAVVFPDADVVYTNDNTPTVTWTPTDAAMNEYIVSMGGDRPSRKQSGSNALDYDITSVLTDGSHDLFVWGRTKTGEVWSPIIKYQLIVDTSSPAVASVTAMTADGTYAAGTQIDILVNFNEAVTINGSATLTLSSGGTATYMSGSGTSTLSFRYTVTASDVSSGALDVGSAGALQTSGAIKDSAGNSAILTLPTGSQSGALPTSSNIIIQGNAPSVLSVSSTAADGFYRVGQVLPITVTFSTSVTVGGAGTPSLTLETGATDAVVSYTSGSPGTVLTFNYTVSSGEISADLEVASLSALALNGGTIRDSSTSINAALTLPALGGPLSLSGPKAIVIDTTAPGAPQISVATSSFNTAFSTNISQNATTDINFKEFRYTTTGVDPTCSTGTASTTQPTVVNIPAATTTLKAVSCDQAGNISAVTTATYTYDNTPPSAPNVTSTSAYSASASVTWTWTAGGGGNGNYRYRLDNSDLSTGTTATVATSATIGSLSQGAHTLYVQERDAAGNWSTSGSYAVTVDTTPPSAPAVTSASAYSASTSVTWTWTAGGGGNGNYRYRLDNSDLSTGTSATATTSATIGSLSQGAHTLYVQERDAAGNWSTSGSYAVTVDTTAPGAPQISVATSSFNTAFSTNISQNATTDINFKEFRYTTTGVDPTCSTGTASTSQPTVVNIPAATTTLKAVSCDQAGNISAVTSRTYTYDNTPPTAPSVTSGSSTSSSSTVTWTWTAGGGGNGNYRYKLDSTDLTTGATATTGTSATLNSLADGARTLYVQERDDAGNWSASGSYTVTVSSSGGLAVDSSRRRGNGSWIYLPWTGGTSPYTARLYSDSGCSTEIRSLVNTTSTSVIFGGLTDNTFYYHRVFDSASGATACTSFSSQPPAAASVVASVTGTSYNSISLSFSEDATGGHTSFLVWQFSGTTCGGAGTLYTSVPAVSDAGTATVTGLTGSTGYSFRIFADMTDLGDFSGCVNGTTAVSNADGIFPFASNIVVQVKNSNGPLRVVASNGANCTGMSVYDSGPSIAQGQYARIPSIGPNQTVYVKIVDSAAYATCHTVVTPASNPTLSLTSNVPSAGQIDLSWTGGVSPYLLLRFAEGMTNPCEGNGAPVTCVPSASACSDLVSLWMTYQYVVLDKRGGSSYTGDSNCRTVYSGP